MQHAKEVRSPHPDQSLHPYKEALSVERITWQSIIRSYAAGLRDGSFDRDIEDKRTRELTAMLLTLASNYGWTQVDHMLPWLRTSVINRLTEFASDAYWLLTPKDQERFNEARQRAVEILRGI